MLRLRNFLFTLVLAAAAPVAAEASLILNLVDQLDGTVTLNYSGQITTTGLQSFGPLNTSSGITPNQGILQNMSSVQYFVTGSPTGSQNFGSGSALAATSSNGSPIYVSFGAPNFLGLPVGYASGSSLTGSLTFTGSLASIGATAGSYSFNWGAGGLGQSVVLNVSQATPVPEPATMAVLAIGSVVSGYTYRRRTKRAKAESVPK